jgi:hypothetical protein
MKSIHKIVFLIALLLILFYYYFQQLPASERAIVSIKPQTSPIKTIEKKTPKNNKITTNKKKVGKLVSDKKILSEQKNQAKVAQTDYISAFRDWQYFQNCYTDIEDFGNDKDPLDTLAERFADNPRESQQQPSSQQNLYYQSHVDMCKSLINGVGDETDDYFQIHQKLNNRFLSTKAETDEEKQLEQALQMIKQLNSYKSEYGKAHLPQSNLPVYESNEIHNQIESLTVEMMRVYDGNNPLSPEQIQLIKDYSEKIESLQITINESQQINPEMLNKIERVIDGYLNTMDSYLQQVQSPDAFILMATELYKFEYLQKETNVLKNLQSQTSIYDLYYLSLLNNITIPLVACSMNYPCDADSDLIMSYCLGLKDSMFNQACGTNLEEFYFNFYIGQNQLSDVNNYFNYLVNRYAN